MSDHGLERYELESWDGTLLRAYRGGNLDAAPLVICNGLGGSVSAWSRVIRRLEAHFRILSWDYRGLHLEGPAPAPGTFTLAHHARDLIALLHHECAASPILAGWSMGVQVALELHRTHPKLVRAAVAVHGTPRTPLRTAFGSDLVEQAAPAVFLAMRGVGRSVRRIAPPVARSDWIAGSFVRAAQGLGLMADEIDLPTFQALAEDWLGMDFAAYADNFEELARHDASELLPAIATPTLVITGGADRMTPSHLAREMVERMPAAQLHEIPGATHFGLMEHPDEIADAIQRFVDKRVALGSKTEPAYRTDR